MKSVIVCEAPIRGQSVTMAARLSVTRALLIRLRDDGWFVARNGPGDYVQFKHPTKPGRVTLDTGRREQAIGTLRSIYRQAGWPW